MRGFWTVCGLTIAWMAMASPAIAQQRLAPISSDQLEVAAEFPAAPEMTTKVLSTAKGTYETTRYRLDETISTYILNIDEFTFEPNRDLNYLLSQMAGADGSVFSSRAITIDGMAGLEAIISKPKTKLRGYVRIALAGRRLYQALVFGPADADATGYLRFVRSLRIGAAAVAMPQVATIAPVTQVSAPRPKPVSAPAGIGMSSGPRLALLVGNSSYGAAIGTLQNPVRDVDLLALALRNAGFQVEVVKNADQAGMKRAISRFGERLENAGRKATGLFFYAGHGVQSRGVNYLVPVNAAIDREADIDIEAVAADTVLRQMEAAGTSTSIVILDACRNMPVQRSFRDGSRGLARMETPNGSFVAYSTAPGSVAADGAGAHSPFAQAFASELATPGEDIQSIFLNVRRSVFQATGGKQTPWDSSSLMEKFVFTR